MFSIDKRPDFTEDLARLKEMPNEIAIQGTSKNLERLKEFPTIEKMWLYGFNQAQFDNILSRIRPKYLYIYELRVADLTSLERLESTEAIHLCWNTKADKLWDLSKNTELRSLVIEDFKKLHSIEPLKSAQPLEELELSGGIWNTLKLDTLEPLKYLTNLKVLSLLNIRVMDESLASIACLENLKELTLSNQFPTEEYARLSVKLPNTKCEYFQPYVKLGHSIDGKDVMVIGKRKPFLNWKTDQDRLKKYIKQFEDFQDKFTK